MPVIPALRRLRQEDHESKHRLGQLARSCLRKERRGGKGRGGEERKLN
jgi:hypothetical protein